MKGNTDSFVKEINHELIGCNCQLISALIIYPKDFLHQKLIRNVILREDINIATFKAFESRFVNDPQNPRTLTFEKYRESVKYSSLKKSSKTNNLIPDSSYPIYILDEFEIKPPANDLNKQKRFWRVFIQELKNSISQAYATLWSYIVLKKVSETNGSVGEVVCSAYLTFSGDIGKKNSIIIDKICQDYLYVFVNDHYNKELQSQATRAAISQVMARNTSHNIGAHVMNKLIGDLRELSLLLFDQVNKHNYKSTGLKNLHGSLVKELENSYWYKGTTDNILKNKALKNEILLAQISHFNNYVKCRMDYLADISFGTPLMQTNKYAYEDLFKRLDEVRLLLEHISGLSDFKYKIEFRKNGKRFKASKADDNDTDATEDDLLVAIPNDILGTQAFYNILENIIRNTAKHSSLKPDITIFTVNFIDRLPSNAQMDFCQCKNSKQCKCGKPKPTEIQNILNEFVAIEVYDNIVAVGAVRELTDEDKKEYKEIMGKELNLFKEKIDEIVFAQNKKLNEDILHENKLRSYSLGLVEMDASAAYLRKRPVEYINHPSYNIQYDESWSRDTELNGGNQEIRGINCRHFLKAFKTKEEFEVNVKDEKTEVAKKGSALGYRFFLHRPTVVLVVTNEVPANKDDLKKQGVWIVPPQAPTEEEKKQDIKDESFETHLREGKVYSHEFVVYAAEGKNIIEPLIKIHKTSLPIRTLELTKDELKNLLSKEDSGDKKLLEIWEEECWKLWEVKLKSDKLYGIKGEIVIGNSIDLTKCNCEKGDDFNAVILDHGKQDWTKYSHCKIVDYLDDLSTKAFEKLPSLKTVLPENKLSGYIGQLVLNKSQRWKIREAILTKILVIDERVQNQINGIYYEEDNFKILNQEVYKRSGIIIPALPANTIFEEDSDNLVKSKFNLSANDIDEVFGKALTKYIRHYTTIFKRTDFILIHYSILERVFKNEANKTVKINEFLESITEESMPQIVITSGRGGGALTELTSKVRFVNLSSVITSFVEIKSKYYCNYLLHSSRKNNSKT